MAITLPLDNQSWPLMRVLTLQRWGSAATTPQTSAGGWEPKPALDNVDNKYGGFQVLDLDRCCLPMIGRARVSCAYGVINGQQVTAPNLTGHEIRIQGARSTTDGSNPTWVTIWWGEVVSHEDVGWPGSAVKAGDRVYHCVDGLSRIQRWILERHGLAAIEGTVAYRENMRGNPGYNISRSHTARIAGNRWNGAELWTADAGNQVLYHGMPGAAGSTTWTDQQAIEHALGSSRRPQDPAFPLSGSLDRLQGASSWKINDGDNCWDLLTRIMRRQRGKGLAFLSWSETADPTGPLTVGITVNPQMAVDVEYDPATGAEVTIQGSYSAGTNAGNVDLIGDHRVVDGSFKLGDRDQFKLDALETVGEPIEVLVTLAYTDGLNGSVGVSDGRSLRRRWTNTEQTSFRALTTAAQRIDERWRPVYQLHGLPLTWDFVVGNGDNQKLTRCDYRCNGEDSVEIATLLNGAIIAESQFSQGGLAIDDTSIAMCEIMSDLPLYEGWDYQTSTPVRWDGTTEVGNPQRRPVLGMFRISENRFTKWEETVANLNVQADGIDLLIYNQANSGDGKRIVSDTSAAGIAAGLNASFSYTALAVTVGLRLPHRVRFYSGMRPSDPDCKRKATIYQADHHLWLAHPGAIWDLQGTTGSASTGHTPRRAAAGGVASAPGLLRDDRAALARLHYLAWSWYSADRRSATWAIRDCGLLGSYLAFQGAVLPTDGSGSTSFTYPSLGKMIDALSANGEVHAINTPVTRIAYDHATGTTTWSTDWSELEME